jgi:signal transduction histidine kinase
VQDSGAGIPAAEQERIFDRYYRRALHEHGSQSSPRAEGTGLGLAIARYLVDLHGGRIWVESQLGHGSTFLVKLPLAKSY